MATRIKGITIEIGGDLSPLSKALGNLNKDIGSTQSELRKVERLLKLDPGNTILLEQKQELLTKAIADTENKVEALKAAKAKADADMANGTQINEKQYRELERQIISGENSLSQLKSEAQRTEAALNGIDERPVEEVADAAQEAEDALKDAGKEASGFGDYLKAGAIVEGTKSIISGMQDLAEESREYLKIMGSLEVSSEKAGYTAEQTSESYKTLYGVLGDDQTAATTVANLQALGLSQSQLTTLINSTVGAWATYGDSIPIDGLAESINETIRAGQVTGTFADVLNWGSKEGETFGVALKANTEANKKWNDAVKSATTAEDFFNLALQDAGSEAERANIVMQALASQGLTEAGEAWQENNAALVESNRANADMQESMAKLSEQVMPIVTKITDAVTAFINFILDNKEAVVGALVAIGTGFAVFKISGLVSGLVSKLQGLFTTVKNGQGVMAGLNAVMNANPIMLIVSAIAALVAGFIYLWNTSEDFRNFWIGLWEGIKNVFFTVVGGIVNFFTVTIPDATASALQASQQFDDWLTGIFTTDWSESFGALGEILNGFFANIGNLWNSIKQIFQGIIDFVTGIFTGDWSKAWEGIKSIFSGVWNGLVSIAKAPINAIIALINGMIDAINWVIEKINLLSFDVPDWVPLIGGQHWGFSLPTIGKIPYLAKGGVLNYGSAVVGEAGPELLTVKEGRAQVTPLNPAAKAAGWSAGEGVTVTIGTVYNYDTDTDTDALAEIIGEKLGKQVARREAVFA